MIVRLTTDRDEFDPVGVGEEANSVWAIGADMQEVHQERCQMALLLEGELLSCTSPLDVADCNYVEWLRGWLHVDMRPPLGLALLC